MKLRCAVVLGWLCCLLCIVPLSAQTRRALLIGINTYQPAGTSAIHPPGCTYGRCELGYFENLEGSVNDAQSMADLLTSPKFGFPANQVILLTNPAPRTRAPGLVLLPADKPPATAFSPPCGISRRRPPERRHRRLLRRQSWLAARQQQRNQAHRAGQRPIRSRRQHPGPLRRIKGGYDVRDREMTRIFNSALDKGIHLTIIFDNCHSGGVTRGIPAKYRARDLPFDPRDIAEAPEPLAGGQPRPAPTQRTDNPALVFSAVQQDQSSKEMPDTVPPTESHGAFTAALVEALQVLPADAPAEVVYQRVRAVLGNEDVPDEDPDLDATVARREQPLFGGAASDSSNIRAAVLGTAANGNIWLDVGRVTGIGVGSEFTSEAGSGPTVQLRVIASDGLARSIATVVAPSGATVKTGDIFELANWTPAQSTPLRVWHWPATLSQADILAAVAQIRTAGLATVSDPAEEPWTHMLSWDGTNWTLQQAGAASSTPLGPAPTSDSLRQNLPAGAKLWVNLPPSRELAAQLLPPDPTSAVQSSADLAGAHYALTGVLTPDGPAWAWFHKNELVAGPPSPNLPPHTPGCSPASQYPVRTDWVAISDADSTQQAAATLNRYASLLAKVHGWLQLANSPADASNAAYYSLALLPAAGGPPIVSNTLLREKDVLKIGLQANGRVRDKRWVYILDINCQGQGTVVYPGGNSDNQFPNESDTGRLFVLPGEPEIGISPPFGVDTLILLSTAQPLSDQYVLNFEGVAKTRGAQSPLEQLLSNTSAGTRGDPGQVPTNWSIGLTTIRSVPQSNP